MGTAAHMAVPFSFSNIPVIPSVVPIRIPVYISPFFRNIRRQEGIFNINPAFFLYFLCNFSIIYGIIVV